MKATGIVRRLDQLGRIVIPKELRTTLDLKDTDPVEIFTEGDRIILRKYQPSCIFCGEAEDLVQIDGKNVCRKCVERIGKL
jgi:transcriptional pleiotropic regulator of transition state genes